MSDFLMPVDDVFTISGRGVVLTGSVLRGRVSVGDLVELVGLTPLQRIARVTGVESFRRTLDHAVLGDQVGILLKDLAKDVVEKGMVLAAPLSLRATSRFELVLDAPEGGLQPFIGVPPRGPARFRVFLAEVEGEFEAIVGGGPMSAQAELRLRVELARPLAMEVGSPCAVRFTAEGAHQTGRVSALLT